MNTPSFSLPYERISGLRPDVWISVGAGFAREDIKSLLLIQEFGFIGEAVLTLQELCLKITQISSDRVLSSSARQEVLRMLLSEPRIMSELHELKRMRRQKNFARRLDLALQTGRMTFAHSQEEEVYEERLKQSLGSNALRVELRAFTKAYEVWMEVSSWVDLPILIRFAIQKLRDGWPSHLAKPKEVWSLSIQNAESLEREFWDVLGQIVEVKTVSDLSGGGGSSPDLSWHQWHTLDDAAESLAEQLKEKERDLNSNWNDYAILIPDIPAVRRSLRRALEAHGLPLADLRDPTQLRWDEVMKWALLPLEVVARNYDRQKVTSWLRVFQMQDEFPAWVGEIHSRGIRHGLPSYLGGLLSGVHSRLLELGEALGGRKTCAELGEAHLKILRSSLGVDVRNAWVVSFFEHTWNVFEADMARIGQCDKKAPTLFWLERLQTRLSEASPPVASLKPREGIRLYRLQQAPVQPASFIWVFGLPSSWLSGDGTQSYWFSEREREILATEFAVRSSVQVREERISILKSWVLGSREFVILDSHYDEGGRERESILPILKEIQFSSGFAFTESPIEKGSHPRFRKSYSVVRPLQPQFVELPPLKKPIEITATTLDRYTRCSFQALAYHRWKVRDHREPDTELWPDIRGNILHEAVRLLLKSMGPDFEFRLTPHEALEQAWKIKRPKGLIRSQRVEEYVKSRLSLVLETFCQKEREYAQRSGGRPVSLEDAFFRLDYPEFSIVGQPDRIDRHSQGLFILDYKTSGTVPHGTEIMEQSYRLQLPFYAVAARKKALEPVIGVQFVELDRKGGRKSGIFFKQFNGKEPGKLTSVRSNSKSLIKGSPDETWDVLEEYLVSSARNYVNGIFEARPRTEKREKECNRCSIQDLCGFRRLVEGEKEGEASSD